MDDTRYKHGAFSWSELLTTDAPAAIRFYTQLFGWTTEAMHMGPVVYTVVKAGDVSVGGIMPMPPDMPAKPPAWGSYVSVNDIDATAKLAVELGGKVLVPPQDIPEIGRFAILLDPQGAVISAITYIKR